MLRLVKIIFLIFISFLSSCKTKINDNQNDKNFSTYDNTWIFFNLNNSIKVKVLNHLKNEIHCGTVALASVTIVIDEKDNVFRVLDLCNLSDYKVDEYIILIPNEKPDFNVNLPYRFYINPDTKKREQFDIDKNTLKTTYAHIEKINQ